jgi:ABC-type Fe3+-siderophore transport system permease subunit
VTSPEQPARPEQQPEFPATAPAETAAGAPAEAATGAPAAEPTVESSAETTVTVHRSPRYFSFMIVGAVLGAILALVLTVVFPENDQFEQSQVFGFLLLAGVVLGVALGSIVALILDRAIGRTTATVVADRLASSKNTLPSDIHSSENTE